MSEEHPESEWKQEVENDEKANSQGCRNEAPFGSSLPTLDQLGIRHGTDQSSKFHSYLDILAPYFTPKRFMAIRFLELGSAGGASIRVWRDFFQHGSIWGIDHNPKYAHDVSVALALETSADRVRILYGDVTDRSLWQSLTDVEFDIVLDDASHFSDSIEAALICGWDRLKPGGLWIVEDIHHIYRHDKGPHTFIDYLKAHLDYLNEFGHDECAKPRIDAPIKSLTFFKSLCIIEKALSP